MQQCLEDEDSKGRNKNQINGEMCRNVNNRETAYFHSGPTLQFSLQVAQVQIVPPSVYIRLHFPTSGFSPLVPVSATFPQDSPRILKGYLPKN